MRALRRDHPVRVGAKVLVVLIYDLNESGDLAAISALGIAMLAVTFAMLAMARPRLRGCALTG